MSSGGKGGGGSKSYNVFGSIPAAVGIGPLLQLNAVLADGKAIFEGALALTGDFTDLTPEIDGKYLTTSSRVILLHGTATQSLEAAFDPDPVPFVFSRMPDHRGVAVLLLHRFLFGREKYSPANIETESRRKPVVDEDLVDAADNVVDDGQVNPVAALAEIYTSIYGTFRFPVARFVAADWLAAAAWCNASAARRARTFCSPLFIEQADMRRVAGDLLAMFDGAHYFDAQGRLGLKLLEPGVDPGGLITLDAAKWAEGGRPKQDGLAWDAVPTRLDIEFRDRTRKFKRGFEPARNLIASRVLALDRPQNVGRLHITRRDQAADWGNELIRRGLKPASPVALVARRGHAVGLTPGSKVKVDLDPEPGGTGSAQLCVVTERREGATGPVKLTLQPDTLVPATLYSPDYGTENPEAAEVPPVEHALIVPLPPLPGADQTFGVLATRPAEHVVGMRVFFDTDNVSGVFADLGLQPGFAARGTLDAGVAETDDEITVQLTDGADGADAYLAGLTPGAEISAETDELLLVLANMDGDGRVVIDADGNPELEFASVVSRSAVAADTHDYTVLRARKGLLARAWTTACQAWLVPSRSLVAWTHPALASLLASGEPGFVRLVAYTADAEDDTSPPPEFSFVLPGNFNLKPTIAWTAPATSTAETDGSGDLDVAFDVTDLDGDLIHVRLESRKDDGSSPAVHLNESFAPTTGYSYPSTTLNFGAGTWVLSLTATDKAGSVATAQRTISRGASMPLPDFSAVDGTEFYGNLTVAVTTVSPGTQIHWQVRALGSSAPTTYSTHVGTSKNVTLNSSCRLWARSSDGGTHSAWVWADYYRLGSGPPP